MNQQVSPTRSVLLQMPAKLPPPPSLGLKGTNFLYITHLNVQCNRQEKHFKFPLRSSFLESASL